MPVRLALLVAALLSLVPACTQDSDTPSAAPSSGAGPAACDPEVEGALRAWAQAGFSGTVTLTAEGEVTCEVAYGLADQAEGRPNEVDTVFAVGSVAKAFTAAAVLDLVAADEVALDDRAGDLVPGLGGPAAEATVEQLLLHTSGLTGSHGEDHQPLSREDAVAAIGGLERAEPAGSAYLYSNAGYTLLALIVEEVTGTPYRDHLAAEVLQVDGEGVGGFWDGDPAAPGPRAVGYEADGEPSPVDGSFAGPHWALAGNGDVAMTTTDLARWTDALFTGSVIAPAAVDLLEETTFDHDEGAAEVPGWVRLDERLGEPAYAASGGGGDVGHEAVTAWFPESGRAVALSSNTPEVTAEDLLAEIGPALVAGDPLPRPSASEAADPEEAARLAGTYALDGGDRLVVAEDDAGLAVAAEGPAAVAALFPPADDDEAADRAAHEDRVEAMLAGETEAGREEVALLEDDLGPIDGVEVVGTIDVGELRTYVLLAAGDEDVLVWYAVDEAGGIAGVEITDDPPTLVVAPAGSGTYRPSDPTGHGPEVTLAFADDALTVTGPGGATTARRAG